MAMDAAVHGPPGRCRNPVVSPVRSHPAAPKIDHTPTNKPSSMSLPLTYQFVRRPMPGQRGGKSRTPRFRCHHCLRCPEADGGEEGYLAPTNDGTSVPAQRLT